METIDELGRRAAQAARAEAEAHTDVEVGLARILAGEELEPPATPPRRRWAVFAAAAAAVVALIVAGIVWAQQDPSPRMVPSTTPEVTPEPTTPPPPVTTTTPTTTPPTSLPRGSGLSVSYRNPPPLLEPAVFATIDLPNDDFFDYFAATENGGAVTIDHETGDAIVVELDGSTRRVPLEPRAFVVAAGPGDVLYAFLQGTADGLRVVGIPLSGERAGQVVASATLEPASYTELPSGAFGHGRTGIIARVRQVGEQVIGYVDADGQPLTWPGPPPPFYTIDDNDTVRTADGSMEWPLDIERHPEMPTQLLEGPLAPAPTAGGGAVYWTGIGPPVDPNNDYSDSTINVVAVLSPDGSGQWYRLPDGWSVAASDVWSTILSRRIGDQIELATLTPTSPNVPGTTVVPTTVVPTTAPPTPASRLAEEIGASKLIVREPGRVTVFEDGSTTDVTTPPDVYVQTDGDFLWWDIVTGETTSRSVAATLDGTVICEVDGVLHRLREDPDGGYIASVERANPASDGSETPVPNFAIDCETNETQPIATVTWNREGGSRYIERVGERTFTFNGDAEGNADVTNESGISINGEDYAGYHTFNADGSRVVYGDMSALASPHVTDVLRSRDTTTGELLWSTELDQPVGLTHWYGDRIVALAPADGVPGLAYEAVIVLDALTGDVIKKVPTSLDIAFVG